MSILGNLILVIATLLFFGLASVFMKEPPRNDGAVGYYWTLIILNGLFIIAMILVALIIGAKDGFDWVSPKKSTRFWLVTIALLATLATSSLSGLLKYEYGPVPGLIRFYAHFAPILIPVVMIMAFAILLNTSWRESVPVNVYKWPLVFIAVLGITGSVAGVVGYFAESAKNRAAAIKSYKQSGDENHNRILADIDSNDVMTQFVFLLGFTSQHQDPEIREKAFAKIKTHPQWQQEIARLFQTEWAPEVFYFTAYNDVDDPASLAEPIRLGILQQAQLIRERIRKSSHPSHLYPGVFMFEVERVLLTADRYKGNGVDYVPAVREIKAALDEPHGFDVEKFDAIAVVDKWLKKNGG